MTAFAALTRRHGGLFASATLAFAAVASTSASAQNPACSAAPAQPAKPKKKLRLGGLLAALRDSGAAEILPAASGSRATRAVEGAASLVEGGDPGSVVADATGSDQAGRAAGTLTRLTKRAPQGC